jgi:hypothetical protein
MFQYYLRNQMYLYYPTFPYYQKTLRFQYYQRNQMYLYYPKTLMFLNFL